MNIINPSLPIGPKSQEQKILGDSEFELAQKILCQIKQFQNCRLFDDPNLTHFPAERSKSSTDSVGANVEEVNMR